MRFLRVVLVFAVLMLFGFFGYSLVDKDVVANPTAQAGGCFSWIQQVVDDSLTTKVSPRSP